MPIIKINSLDLPELKPYYALTEAQLLNRANPQKAIFIAESPKVIRVAIERGFKPVSMLCEEKHIYNDAAFIRNTFPELKIYTGEREILSKLTGYTLTRGVLCAMKRPQSLTVEQVCTNATRLAILDGVVDTTNIGAIFRSAAALGIDGILLTTTSCDPFNRRAIRVSMGAVFSLPWAWINNYNDTLKQLNFKTIAMALRNNSINIDSPILKQEKKLAIIVGTEGDGLSQKTINDADFVTKIPMFNNVDSLNVSNAAAIAFWELTKK